MPLLLSHAVCVFLSLWFLKKICIKKCFKTILGVCGFFNRGGEGKGFVLFTKQRKLAVREPFMYIFCSIKYAVMHVNSVNLHLAKLLAQIWEGDDDNNSRLNWELCCTSLSLRPSLLQLFVCAFGERWLAEG